MSPGALVLAVAIPILFLHVHYQPGVAIHLGSTTVDAYLSDFAVLAVVAAAVAAGVRDGFAPLARGRVLWLVAALFFCWVAFEIVHGRSTTAAYEWQRHLVTGAKFGEYALLAPAAVLLVRTRRDLLVVLWSLALWAAVAAVVGVVQFFGADILLASRPGRRQAAFLSTADFAALAVAVLLVGLVALTTPRARLGRALTIVAIAGGAVGAVVAGAMASILGLAAGLVALAAVLLARRELELRRALAALAVVLAVVAGAVAIRGNDLENFARFLGAPAHADRTTHIETYAHRTLLSWIGYRIWVDHRLLGVGWEGSAEPAVFGPYLPAAHRRFANEAPLAFPSETRRYGVQNSWVQALADLGVPGLVLWLGIFAAGAVLALRGALRRRAPAALVGLCWIGLLLGLWTGQGFVAGIPLDVVTWLGLGFAAGAGPGE